MTKEFDYGDVAMEKVMKITAVLLCVLIIISTLTAWNYSKKDNGLDPFGANDIVENIKNMEINMTSVVYVKNAEGEWEEYQRLHGEENRNGLVLIKSRRRLLMRLLL